MRAKHGMVVSSNPYASDVGIEILKKGGHAVDAAVAVGFALAVAHPAAGNVGGGGFMVIHEAKTQTEIAIDYREMAPAAAHPDMYLDEKGNVVQSLSTTGYLASGVPGSVAGMYLAWEKFGKLPWADLIKPAVDLARDGFLVSFELSQSLKKAAKRLSSFPASNRIFLRGGNFYREGEVFRQPELARTLEFIAAQGPTAFYEGEIAHLIAKDMKANGGNITLEDLKNYKPKVREPIRGTYRGCEIISVAPPSSGGIILVQMLNMIEPFPVGNLGHGSSQSFHLMAEVMRRAFADRAAFLGDPDFTRLPVKALTSKNYAASRSESIRRDWSSPSKTISHGDPSAFGAMETTHYSVVDSEGNGVATTTTINRLYGSGVTVPEAGFLMNNEMDDFASKPGVPNTFGLIQGKANAIAPRKRPLSSMTPTLVKKDNKLFMVLGSPGGPRIINTVFQILLNVIDHRLDIQEAVDAPRIHHQWLPDELVAELGALVRDVEIALQEKGHKIVYRDRIGNAHCIMIDPETGIRLGAPDPRSDSKASGY
ncbi:MAG: gamma-glutamyltransferase [Acidobacteriota bacterium]